MRAARMARYMMAVRNNGGADTGEAESRTRYPRREDGTFRPRNNRTYEYSMGDDTESRNEQNGDMRMRMRGEGGGRMNTIGFGDRNEGEYRNEVGGNYYSRVENHGGDEMSSRSGSKESGGAYGAVGGITQDKAKRWVQSMRHADGGRGEHWSLEQIKKMSQEKGGKIDPLELYVIINSLYSDFCTVFQKHGVTSPEFYFDMAKAWIEDSDAVEDKVAMYYDCIVKH